MKRLDSSHGREPANSALGSEQRAWIQTLPANRPNILPHRLREKWRELSALSVLVEQAWFGPARQALPLAERRLAIPQEVASPLASPVRDLLHAGIVLPAKTGGTRLG